LIEIGLRRSGRPDLSTWARKGFHQRHHLENQALHKEFRKHVQAGKKELFEENVAYGRIKLKITTTTESEAEQEEALQISWLHYLFLFCLVAIVCMGVTIVLLWRLPDPKPKPKRARVISQVGRDTRFKVYTNEDETDNDNGTQKHVFQVVPRSLV